WQPANAGIENKFVKSLAVVNGIVYAGTIGNGLFRSSNHGNSWTDANGNALNSSTIYAITYSTPHLVVVSDNLIFYSDNRGKSWFIDQSSPFILTGVPAFLTRDDSVIVTAGSGVYRSFDGGVHWGNFITVDLNTNIVGIIQLNDRTVVGSKN